MMLMKCLVLCEKYKKYRCYVSEMWHSNFAPVIVLGNQQKSVSLNIQPFNSLPHLYKVVYCMHCIQALDSIRQADISLVLRDSYFHLFILHSDCSCVPQQTELSHFNSPCPVQQESYLPGAGLVINIIVEKNEIYLSLSFHFPIKN